MRPPSAAQSRAGAVAPAPRGFPVVACPDSIARDTRCLLLTHTSIKTCPGGRRTSKTASGWQTSRGTAEPVNRNESSWALGPPTQRDLLERARLGGIDPDLGGRCGRRRTARGKALGVGRIGRGEHAGALGHALLGQAEVHGVGREQAEAAVVMFGVVPGEEVLAVSTRVLDRAEAVRERRPVLERLELNITT